MDLLDRYLQAVKKYLPWQRQDDIIAELRANLESQLEDKEAELGRPLTQSEAEAWLKQIGSPLQVAGRYQPQQYLIGPAVFPIYWFVLRTAFLWAMIIYTIVSVVLILTGTPSVPAVVEAVVRIPGILITVAAWVTLAFAAIEFGATHYPSKFPAAIACSMDWIPSTLPPLQKEFAPGKKPRSYTCAVAEVVFGFLALIWLLLIPQHPFLLWGPGALYLQASPFQLAAVWVQFYWWIVALTVLQLGWRSIDLWRGSWSQPWPGQQIAMTAFGLIPLGVVLAVRDHALVIMKHPAVDQAKHGETLNSINKAIYLGFMLVCAISVLRLVWEIGRTSLNVYRVSSN